jgi:hypothetical protein
MVYREQYLLEQAYVRTSLREGITESNIHELINKFIKEVLSQYDYKTAGQGHLNCAWATQTFCNFCKRNGIPCKAIYFVWPAKEVVSVLKAKKILPSYYEDEGMSHIAPVVGNTIVDFTIGQFYPQEKIKLTPLNKWQNVYGKFGYGTNFWRGKTHFLDTYENLIMTPGLQINPISPYKKHS